MGACVDSGATGYCGDPAKMPNVREDIQLVYLHLGAYLRDDCRWENALSNRLRKSS